MFRASTPATDEAFFDRTRELKQLLDAGRALRRGDPRWVALIGPRKVGKTSLLLELARRAAGRSCASWSWTRSRCSP